MLKNEMQTYTSKTIIPELKPDPELELDVHVPTGPFTLQPPAHAHTLVRVKV